ncbi:MAG: precorrin-3B synthase [Phreatobacter sp.]|uniref:precorrin-3B synthase n=1 Tax=Phreatobacter sp. TaxID=1966341 RepID=UPI001A458101|nr:precorrin-3B synthase [Phreatobacter sp.]MBL8570560.1 precorrin-3B synthase [Phreatobacter sp.]
MIRTNAALRRGWCPGALRPMETGDGWLVRLHPRGGRLSVDDLRRIADLARRHGSGLIDITARGNLQLRGVRPETHGPLVEELLATGLADADEGDGPRRLVLASPLAGRQAGEAVDAARLAEGIEAACADLTGLPAKALVVVDGGGLPLEDIAADLRLHADAAGALVIALPDGRWIGSVAPAEAPAAVRALLAPLAEAHRREPGRFRRLRDLPGEALEPEAAALGLHPVDAPVRRPAAPRAGIVPERGGAFAVMAAAPFGRLDAAQLDAVAAVARSHAAHDIRTTPWRGLSLTGLVDPAATLAALAGIGLIADPADPRLAVHACPGAPACLRGEAPAQADATRLAMAAAGRIAGGLTLHVSGCAKGCAHPGRAGVTLVGQGGGYGLVLDGTASDPAHGRFAADILARLLAAPGDLAFTSVPDTVSP